MSAQFFNRRDFAGRTDIYATPQLRPDALDKALKGLEPYDVSGSVLSDSYVTDSGARLRDYQNSWNFYLGKHFLGTSGYQDGDRMTAHNFCKRIVDKRVAWVVGNGFDIISEKGNEDVATVYDSVWKYNGGSNLIRTVAQFGFVNGDAFLYYSIKTKDDAGNTLPRDQQTVRISALNPAYCFPLWREDDLSKPYGMMIQFPIMNAQRQRVLFSGYFTANEIIFYENGAETTRSKNPIGMLPFSHIPFDASGDSMFGRSLLADIIPLNVAYNNVAMSMQKVIKYHGEPTTLVFGTRMSAMERGANRVWSNLPIEGDVRNLEMQGDLGAFKSEKEDLEMEMYSHGRTPKISFDSHGLAVSNTSGVAMHLLFQPLYEGTVQVQDALTCAMRQGNRIIEALHSKVLGIDLSALADTPESTTESSVKWHSILPRDRSAELDMIVKKIEQGILSKSEAMRQLGDATDSQRHAIELAADKFAEWADAQQKQKAMNGIAPNPTAAMIGSPFINEDVVDISSRLSQVDPQAKTKA